MTTDTVGLVRDKLHPTLLACKCGNTNMSSKHDTNVEQGFCIWIVCEDCGVTSHSCKTFLDAVRNWNKRDTL